MESPVPGKAKKRRDFAKFWIKSPNTLKQVMVDDRQSHKKGNGNGQAVCRQENQKNQDKGCHRDRLDGSGKGIEKSF